MKTISHASRDDQRKILRLPEERIGVSVLADSALSSPGTSAQTLERGKHRIWVLKDPLMPFIVLSFHHNELVPIPWKQHAVYFMFPCLCWACFCTLVSTRRKSRTKVTSFFRPPLTVPPYVWINIYFSSTSPALSTPPTGLMQWCSWMSMSSLLACEPAQ